MREEEQAQESPVAVAIRQAQEFAGQRVRPLDVIQAPRGWVINGSWSEELWQRCGGWVLPLKARSISLAKFQEIKVARRFPGQKIHWLLICDEETEHGYSGGPVLETDLLREDVNEILNEGLLSVQNGDWGLEGMKRRAWMARTGCADTK